jgi:hypothetical protein
MNISLREKAIIFAITGSTIFGLYNCIDLFINVATGLCLGTSVAYYIRSILISQKNALIKPKDT